MILLPPHPGYWDIGLEQIVLQGLFIDQWQIYLYFCQLEPTGNQSPPTLLSKEEFLQWQKPPDVHSSTGTSPQRALSLPLFWCCLIGPTVCFQTVSRGIYYTLLSELADIIETLNLPDEAMVSLTLILHLNLC